ncbi:MAG: cyclic nucleotide-binding domain-containing protein [Bdellovibrionales bacterium]|nr:cyclic nucleotide-binding domain-containing protein [Bdellovibrionales bacterium]
MSQHQNLIQNVYLFKDLSPKELESVNAIAAVETYNSGDEVYCEGDKAASLFFIKFGSVRIRRSGKDDSVDVAQLGTGSHFGEMSFVDGEARSATVIAMENQRS